MENVRGFLLGSVETIFADCLSTLANALHPKHDRGDDNFAYHVLDSYLKLSFLSSMCLFLPLRGFFPLAAAPLLVQEWPLACLSC